MVQRSLEIRIYFRRIDVELWLSRTTTHSKDSHQDVIASAAFTTDNTTDFSSGIITKNHYFITDYVD